MKKLLLAALLLFGAAVPAFSVDRYVLATGGTNSGGCTNINAGCDTVAFAVLASSAGDRINICATDCDGADSGTHIERLVVVYGTHPVGTSFSNAITIRAYPGETITWSSTSGQGSLGFESDDISDVSQQSTHRSFYYIVDGIIFDGLGDSGNSLLGATGADRVRWQNIEVKNAFGQGIQLTGSFHEFLDVNVHTNGTCAGAHGIYMSGGATNNLIDGGNWYSNYGYGIHIYGAGGMDNNIVRNARIYHNNHGEGGGVGDGPPIPANVCSTHGDHIAGGIIAGSGADSEVYNNLIYDNLGPGVQVSYGGADDIKLYNNTLYGNDIGFYIFSASNTKVRNNICYGNVTNDIFIQDGSSTVSNNVCDGTNPLFVNAAGDDFHLQDASTMIGLCPLLAGVLTDFDGDTRLDPTSCGALDVGDDDPDPPPDPGDSLLDDFESYTAATSINTLNGGTGWTGAWTQFSGATPLTVETAPAWFTGKALRSTSVTGDAYIYRLLAGKTGSFTISYSMSLSTATPNNSIVTLLANGSDVNQIRVRFAADGNITTDNSTLVTGYSINTSYPIHVNIDTVNQANKYRVAVGSGAYTAWENCVDDCSSIATFKLADFATNAHTFWLENITDVEPGGGGGGVPPDAGPPPAPVAPVGLRVRLRIRG